MKKFATVMVPLMILIAAALAVPHYLEVKNSIWNRIENPETFQALKQFVAVKRAQAYAATNSMPPEFRTMFKYAERGDWLALSNSMCKLQGRIIYWNSLGYGVSHWHGFRGGVEDFISYIAKKVGSPLPWDYWAPPHLQGIPGETIKEVWGAFEAFGEGNEKYSTIYANDIIDSIPPGSIYFGGTDPGRFIVTALEKSQMDGDPFFTLTQNALADAGYLDYMRSMYGSKIYLPTTGDSRRCSNDYCAAVQRRLENHQLKPGENVKNGSGKIQISGYVAVMSLNALLAKVIFDRNTNREFHVEESFPLDWMYPYLEPHGLIFKLDRQPLAELPDEIVQRDHDYWTNCVSPMIGDWLSEDTSVQEIADFAKKVFLQHDFSGFTGDPQFVQNDYSCKMFSKERSSIAGLYAWRAQHAADTSEKNRMNDAADFAFRQAWALCPYSPEIVVRYVAFLISENRRPDAILVAETAAKMPEMKGRNGDLMRQLTKELQTAQIVK